MDSSLKWTETNRKLRKDVVSGYLQISSRKNKVAKSRHKLKRCDLAVEDWF